MAAPKSVDGASSSTAETSFFFPFFTLWSAFLVCQVIMHHRVDLWPIFATMVACLATRQAVNWVSPSRLFTNIFLSFLCAIFSGFPAAWMAYTQGESQGWASLANHDLMTHKRWQAPSHARTPCYCHRRLLLRDIGLNYPVMFLLCELHTCFAYSRLLVRMLGLYRNGSSIVKRVWSLHWTAFMMARLSVHLAITIQISVNWYPVTVLMEWPFIQWPLMVLFGRDLYKAFLKDTVVVKEERSL
ncbi:hypothetical protein GOP47_0010125 [Adiantum capillus-veneris]|uniref:Uncharacterized protein n=1 Tax=Adiantum capillus-veneris TaxID=13818 RepID=A0A9D4UU68_ADICA|nr:hypothetical protein GOP47_0010125 [Adiantum capillus-veneris]